MKLIVVALLAVGILCNSTFAIAGTPVPFRALMQNGGAQPAAPSSPDAKNQSTSAPPKKHMTTGGKIMTGVGVGFLIIGGTVLIGTKAYNGYATSTDRNELYGAGGATMGIGAVLILLGMHRRSAQ